MPTEKETESIHFKSFRGMVGDIFPVGPVAHTGRFGERAPDGAPDFLIRSQRMGLGIEHREVLKPHDTTGQVERAVEQYCDKILSMGREHAELRGLPYAKVAVLFGNTVPTERQTRLALSRALAELVHEHMPEDRQDVRLEYKHLKGRNLHGVETENLFLLDLEWAVFTRSEQDRLSFVYFG